MAKHGDIKIDFTGIAQSITDIVKATTARLGPFGDMLNERERQVEKWGEQHHPDGTGAGYNLPRDVNRMECDHAFAAGEGTWRHILLEEVYEALAEEDVEKLRAELVQVGAVAAAWIEDIDSREERSDG